MGEAERFLAVGAMLFILGAIGFLTRRNLIVMILSAELMLHGVSITFVTFGRMHHSLEGQAFTIMILTVAACEAGLALSLILALYRNSKSLDVELWDELREGDLPPAYDEEDADEPPLELPERLYFPSLPPAGRSPTRHGSLPPDDITNNSLRAWETQMVDEVFPEPELTPPSAPK
jgi:NADH-quinone oxidoreductase subunit K